MDKVQAIWISQEYILEDFYDRSYLKFLTV